MSWQPLAAGAIVAALGGLQVRHDVVDGRTRSIRAASTDHPAVLGQKIIGWLDGQQDV